MVTVVPQFQESRVCYRHKETVTQIVTAFLAHRSVVAIELTERPQHNYVEVMVDAAIIYNSLQAYNIRMMFALGYRTTKDILRRLALHHQQPSRRLVYLLSYERPPLADGDFVMPEHNPLRLNEPERRHDTDDVVKAEGWSCLAAVPRQMKDAWYHRCTVIVHVSSRF